MSSAAGKDNVRVVIRCRPLSQKEIKDGRKVVVRMDHLTGQVTVLTNKSTMDKEKLFTFDTVFGMDSKQVDVYNETARPIVESVLEGYNGTIFAYGQTGTGKTHTMEGERDVPELKGIIPNSFAHLFGHISKCEGEVQFLVRVSYLELYNEDVRDLLSKTPQQKLEIRERTDIGVYVKDLSSFVVKSVDDMDKLIAIGYKNRAFASTDMNAHSSRSHVIFSITIERCDHGVDDEDHLRMGKLHLVDLAGSERQGKTGATGDRFTEAVKINLSLSTLGNVISALVDGKSTHIPYRNSKLTRLLQDSLGGNAKTVMIAAVGPADYNVDETLNTLRYANRAKCIKNSARINEDPKDAMLREFQKEINELKKMLKEKGSGNEESDEEVTGGAGGKKRRKSKRRASMSVQALFAMKEAIEKEREELLATKDLAEDEKKKAEQELQKREGDLKAAQDQHSELERKLTELNSQVIHGGVNLLEHAEEQERLLESSARELENRKKKEGILKQQLRQKEAEKLDMEEKYATLQEEASGKTRLLKEVWKQFQRTKEEISDLKAEAQRENEELLTMIRELSKEVKLQTLIINTNIPQEYQHELEEHVQWQEEAGDWHMPVLAYAGNNTTKKERKSQKPQVTRQEIDTAEVYLTYQVGPYEIQTLPSKSNMGVSMSSSSSLSGRPRGARKTSGSTKSKQAKSEEGSSKDQNFPAPRGLVSKQQRFA